MAIDHSIYSQMQAPNILGSIQEGLSMRDLLDKRSKEKSLNEAYKAGITQNQDGSTSFDRKKTLSSLAQVDPRAAMEYEQNSAQLDQNKQKNLREKQVHEIDLISRVAGSVKDQASYDSGLQFLSQQGVDISSLPKAYDKGLVDRYYGMALSAKDQMDQEWKQKEFGLREREVGIKDKLATAKAAKDKSDQKAMSVTQAKQLGLYKQGDAAEQAYQSATKKSGSWWNKFDPTSNFQWIDKNDWAPNVLKSEKSQQAASAEDRWVEAYLRDASGAAIPPNERDAYKKDFFPRAGDSKKVVADKNEARRLKMESAKIAATGRDEQVPSPIDQYSDADIDTLYKRLGGE